MLYHRVPSAEVLPIPPSLNEASVPKMATLELWQRREGPWERELGWGQHWQALPSRKAGSRAQVQGGLPGWTAEHSEPSQAKTGMLHWHEMSPVLRLCQCQQVSTRSCAGQPGAAQGVRKADTGPQHTAETGRQRDWLAKQGKISLNIWAVWSAQCSPHSLVLSHFVWCFPPAFSLYNIPFPCYVGTERKETAGRKEVQIFVLFNTDKGFYTRLIGRL